MEGQKERFMWKMRLREDKIITSDSAYFTQRLTGRFVLLQSEMSDVLSAQEPRGAALSASFSLSR